MTKDREPITLAIDTSGIKVADSGYWIRKTWKVRRGWPKIHFAVDALLDNFKIFWNTIPFFGG